MNIYDALNKIVEFIDENLENDIDYKDLAKIMGVNEFTLKRIFGLLTNISLNEYIRNRRLSEAVYYLTNTDLKIIDIALKYHYNNATSFSRAFMNFHNVKPSQVRKGYKVNLFAKLVFKEPEVKNNILSYEIKNIAELNLYGFFVKTTTKTIYLDAPKFYQEIENKYKKEYGNIKYGATYYADGERFYCDKYYVLYDKKVPNAIKISIPQSKWLVFRINSQNNVDIYKKVKEFYLDFWPNCKYNLRDLPELEYYHDGICDFLVAIE